MLSYLGEFRRYWPNLLGACLGLALGTSMNHYTINLFGPPLLADFGWAKSQFALVGSLSLISMFFIPIAGWIVDRWGARWAATAGFIVVPLCFVAYSMMSGSIAEFFAITIVLNIFGILTTSLVFCRVVVERFDLARGMGLSIAMTGPPLIGAAAVPFLGEIIQTEGWRAGYQTLAALSSVGGLFAIMLIGRGTKKQQEAPKAQQSMEGRPKLSALARDPVFLLLLGGMFLVNLPQIIVSSQLSLILLDQGVTTRHATLAVALYAISVIIGRFVCGFALDHVRAHVVAAWILGLPAVGLLIIVSPLNAVGGLAIGILLIGLGQGAEGDVGAYMTSRYFGMRHYSFIYSFLIASISFGSAAGSLILSFTLHRTESFHSFLMISVIVTAIGATCFYLTGWRQKIREIRNGSALGEANPTG